MIIRVFIIIIIFEYNFKKINSRGSLALVRVLGISPIASPAGAVVTPPNVLAALGAKPVLCLALVDVSAGEAAGEFEAFVTRARETYGEKIIRNKTFS